MEDGYLIGEATLDELEAIAGVRCAAELDTGETIAAFDGMEAWRDLIELDGILWFRSPHESVEPWPFHRAPGFSLWTGREAFSLVPRDWALPLAGSPLLSHGALVSNGDRTHALIEGECAVVGAAWNGIPTGRHFDRRGAFLGRLAKVSG